MGWPQRPLAPDASLLERVRGRRVGRLGVRVPSERVIKDEQGGTRFVICAESARAQKRPFGAPSPHLWLTDLVNG